MAFTWQDRQLEDIRRQPPLGDPSLAVRTRAALVLRASVTPPESADGEADYWDLIILRDDFAKVDLNANHVFPPKVEDETSTFKPTYVMILNVASPPGAVSAGDFIWAQIRTDQLTLPKLVSVTVDDATYNCPPFERLDSEIFDVVPCGSGGIVLAAGGGCNDCVYGMLLP